MTTFCDGRRSRRDLRFVFFINHKTCLHGADDMARNLSGIVMFILMTLTAVPAQAGEANNISEYVEGYNWLQQADWLADAQVTYEACGWGPISLIPTLTELTRDDRRSPALRIELVRRFDRALTERRRVEAFLLAFGHPARSRPRGLYDAQGCSETTRQMIEDIRGR
jgi:hypothetical protein